MSPAWSAASPTFAVLSAESRNYSEQDYRFNWFGLGSDAGSEGSNHINHANYNSGADANPVYTLARPTQVRAVQPKWRFRQFVTRVVNDNDERFVSRVAEL